MNEHPSDPEVAESGKIDSRALVLQVTPNGNTPVPHPGPAAVPIEQPTADRHSSKTFKSRRSRRVRAGRFSYEESEETEYENMPTPKASKRSILPALKALISAVAVPLVEYLTGGTKK